MLSEICKGIIPCNFSFEDLTEEDLFYLKLKNGMVYDTLFYFQNLKGKYTSLCYLPKDFNGDNCFQLRYYQKSNVSFDFVIRKFSFLYSHNRFFVKENSVYIINEIDIDECHLYFKDKEDAKQHIKDKIDEIM